jgi:hypothetical protein
MELGSSPLLTDLYQLMVRPRPRSLSFLYASYLRAADS